jgi:predicted ribosome-associated RNA-binding protein Tma20
MKATEILGKIKNILGVELTEKVSLEEMQLENGTIIEAEEFAPDREVFIKSDEEKIPLPQGLYQLEDGRTLVVIDEGLINEIKEESKEEVMSEKEEVLEEQEEDKKEEMQYATREELAEVKEMIEEIKMMIGKDEEKEEVEATQVEETQELKKELSKPAVEPIKHSPEAEVKKKQMTYSKNRPMSTLDVVMSRIANINNK